MKILIGILASRRDFQYEGRVRDTWFGTQPKDCCPHIVDKFFFVGKPLTERMSDERFLDVYDGDGVWWMIDKVKAMFQWALDREYDYVFKCDLDTYVDISRLLKSGFEEHDWSGFGEPYGGSGYWLSQKAIKRLLEKETRLSYDGGKTFSRESEDSWVARNLKREGFVPHQDSRYHSLNNRGPRPDDDGIITSHWYMDGDRIIRFKERLDLFGHYYRENK